MTVPLLRKESRGSCNRSGSPISTCLAERGALTTNPDLSSLSSIESLSSSGPNSCVTALMNAGVDCSGHLGGFLRGVQVHNVLGRDDRGRGILSGNETAIND